MVFVISVLTLSMISAFSWASDLSNRSDNSDTSDIIVEDGFTIARKHNIRYEEMPTRWDEGLPLGNGLMGTLVWGDGFPLILSLDRTDLWDLRPVPEFESEDYNFKTMQKWEDEGRYDDLIRLYEKPYENPGPTKIPAGRIQLTLNLPIRVKSMELHIDRGMVSVLLTNEAHIEIFLLRDKPAGIMKLEGINPDSIEIVSPPFGRLEQDKKLSKDDLRLLDYPPPILDRNETYQSYLQEGWGGFRFAIFMAQKQLSDSTRVVAWAITTNKDRQETIPLQSAKMEVEQVLSVDYSRHVQDQINWWEKYWNTTYVSIPDEVIERRWYHETYKFASAGGLYPIPLQAPWTADNGKIPPWKGDYHHDLNTQMSYWIAYTGNRLDQERYFIEWLWNIRVECFKWTQRFFGLPGLNVPMTTDILGRQIGGWRQYTHSATTACWLAHHFYWHWKYTHDLEFLQTRAYPYLRDCAIFIDAITQNCRDAEGKRKLPLSSSPEINDNKPNAWFKELTNYDLSLIRWLFTALAELAGERGKTDEQKRWLTIRDEFPQLWLDNKIGLLVAKNYPLPHSHRHFSHLMAIYPLGTLNPYLSEDMRIIRTSLDYLDQLGTSQWCGYSFAWKAILSARALRTDDAIRNIKIFSEAFVLRNSFHCNGDQSGKGYSQFTYRPFTLEGNFAAGTAVQELLLQSHNGIIRVFPCVPEIWSNVRFVRLRAEGGFIISAQKEQGKVKKILIQSDKGEQGTLLSPFTGEKITFTLTPGSTIEITENGIRSLQ